MKLKDTSPLFCQKMQDQKRLLEEQKKEFQKELDYLYQIKTPVQNVNRD